mgnify:CR=1 FL=1
MEIVNKYQNGKIYKLISNEMPGLVYYGSTVQKLKDRMSQHKVPSNKCCSKALFAYGTPEIILIENYPCATRKELGRQEGKYQLGNDCINIKTAGLTKSESNKKYNEANKEIVNEKKRKPFKCECGGRYTLTHKASHIRSLKHQKFISSKII